jgi:hypothetical protein
MTATEQWVEGYLRAWHTYEPDDIRALFTEDAYYRGSPTDPNPWIGHDGLVAGWYRRHDAPEDWDFEWEVLGEMDDRGFVQGLVTYHDGRPQWDVLWVIDFAPDGRCSYFSEWSIPREKSDA